MASALAIATSLEDVINSMRVTYLTLTPTTCEVFDPASLPSVKALTVTGEPLRKHTRERKSLNHNCVLEA
jgi:acyl-coenzyme A synthetase/AMP-(fatty) acid ligase